MKPLLKRIPIELTEVGFTGADPDVDRNWFRDPEGIRTDYNGPYSGPQSQSIVPGSTGYGAQTGINTDGKPEDYGLVPGGKRD